MAANSISPCWPTPTAARFCPRRKSTFPHFRRKSLDWSVIEPNGKKARLSIQNTPRRFDFPPHDSPLLKRIGELAAACWDLFRVRGYTRVDFRVDPDGRPWILEVNANPCLSPDAGFAAALERAGISYDEAVARILLALRRDGVSR